ncbi:MAG: hypothetical protein WA667_17425, partial [Candidatus Nitrosopolaris sp.]
MLLLTTPIVLQKQNVYALTPAGRYSSGFSHGEQQAAIDFQNHSPFNSACITTFSFDLANLPGSMVMINNIYKKYTLNEHVRSETYKDTCMLTKHKPN